MTLQLFDCRQQVNERSCCGAAGVAQARAVAGQLGLHHYVVNGQQLFAEKVLRPAWEEYRRGKTPNPCMACNETMKFGLLYEQARRLGARYVATGHHARVAHDPPRLLRGVDAAKDQSYFLFSLRPDQLAMSLLPIGELTKSQVRALARQYGLSNAQRGESQDACIAQRGDLAPALAKKFGQTPSPGTFVDASGRELGRHEGIHHFTVGQRKGLGLALGQRAYVTSVDPRDGRVVVDTDKQALLSAGLQTASTRWSRAVPKGQPVELAVKIRYRNQAVAAQVTRLAAGRSAVQFKRPQSAVCPGQAAVFYAGETVIGGGWIDTVIPRLDERSEPGLPTAPV